MAAHRPLFTSTGLILWNIMKTAQDSYTITIKQIEILVGFKILLMENQILCEIEAIC